MCVSNPHIKLGKTPETLCRPLRWPGACFFLRGSFRNQRDAHFRVSRLLRAHIQAATTKEESSRAASNVASRFLVPLFLAGATMGPLLDGIHGTVHLLDYRVCSLSTISTSSFQKEHSLGAKARIRSSGFMLAPCHGSWDRDAGHSDCLTPCNVGWRSPAGHSEASRRLRCRPASCSAGRSG